MAKAKGTTLIGAVKFLRSRREEAKRVLPPELHHYLDERIQTASWYPEESMLGLIRATLELMPQERNDALRLMGTLTARSHEEGVYSHLLSGGASPIAGLALWSSMHDTGRLEFTREAPRTLRIELIGYAVPSPEMCTITEEYMRESLRMGGSIATSEKLCCQCDGEDRCSWRFKW